MADKKRPLVFTSVFALALVAGVWFSPSPILGLTNATDLNGGAKIDPNDKGGTNSFTISVASGLNPEDGVVVAGAVDHLCLAFNVTSSDGTGALTGATIRLGNGGTVTPSDWEEIRLVRSSDGEVLDTQTTGFPVTFGNFSEPLTSMGTFEVRVTVSDSALDGNVFRLTAYAGDLMYSGTGAKNGGTVFGGYQAIVDPHLVDELVIDAQPGDGLGGAALGSPPVIHLRNSLGELIESDSHTVVTADIVAGAGTDGAQIVAGATAQAEQGVVTFSDLAIDLAGVGYQFVFSAGGLTSDPSDPFNVEVGPPHALRVVAQPGGAVAGFNLSNPPVVEVIDAGGNRTEFDNTTQVTASINEGSGAPGAALTGAATVTVAEGLAAWETLSINLVGSGYEFAFSAEGLEGAVSAPFQVAPSLSGGGGFGAGGGGCALWLGSGQTSGPMPAGMLMLVGLLAVVGLVRRRKATA